MLEGKTTENSKKLDIKIEIKIYPLCEKEIASYKVRKVHTNTEHPVYIVYTIFYFYY